MRPRGLLTVARFVRPGEVVAPLSPHAAAIDRLRRAFNAVRDAQEMLERLALRGPSATRQTLKTSIGDLEWTADALTTALRALQESGPEAATT